MKAHPLRSGGADGPCVCAASPAQPNNKTPSHKNRQDATKQSPSSPGSRFSHSWVELSLHGKVEPFTAAAIALCFLWLICVRSTNSHAVTLNLAPIYQPRTERNGTSAPDDERGTSLAPPGWRVLDSSSECNFAWLCHADSLAYTACACFKFYKQIHMPWMYIHRLYICTPT